MLMGEVRAEGLLRAIDPVVRAGLSLKQEQAIRAAARQDSWKGHPVDIRLALPTPFGRFYLALVAGREHRSAARLATKRNHHPLASAGNLAMVGALIAVPALAGLALYGIFAGTPLP
jgi:hypothetical protein